MYIEVAFQMTKERFKPVGRFGYPRIINVTKHIRQGFFDDPKGAPYHFMLVPVTAAVGIETFFVDESFVFLVPFDEANDPIVPLICCPDQVQFAHDTPQLDPGLALRPRRKPYLAHALYVYQASLQGSMLTNLAYRLKQGLVAITSNTFDLYAQLEQVFQVFL